MTHASPATSRPATRGASSTGSEQRQNALWIFLVVGVTMIAYLPVWRAGFIWDDDAVLTSNTFVKASDGLYRLWFTKEPQDYWPVTYSMLWFEWRLWGMNATGYHVTNVLLHVAEVLLAWRIFVRLGIPGAKLAALLFAIHPVNVESVAWIAQRKNLAAMLFLLGAVWCFLRTDLLAASPGKRLWPARRGHWYWLSLALFVLAVLGKGSAVILPPALALLIWWRRPVAIWDAVRLAPFFVTAGVLTLVNIWFQFHGADNFNVRDDSILERTLGAAAAVWFYLSKALLPQGLMFVYPRWDIQSGQVAWWLPLLAAVAVTAVLWRYRDRASRGVLVAWAFFCVALLPVMGFANIFFMRYSLVADHYQHIALLGVVALVGAGWALWREKLADSGRFLPDMLATLGVVSLAAVTFHETTFYRDDTTLWQETLRRNPTCVLAHNQLGVTLEAAGRREEAVVQYRAAVAAAPGFAENHFNLGKALANLPGHAAEATTALETAVRLRPDFPDAISLLATQLAADPARRSEAIAGFEAALRLKPEIPEAHANLALLLGSVSGRLADAIAHGEAAIKGKPDSPEAHFNHANNLARLPDRVPQAIEHYKTAIRLRPDYLKAHIELGAVLSRMPGRLPEAIQRYEAALRLDPRSAVTHNNLAIALVQSGQSDAALAHLTRAVEIDPNYVDARNNLARLKAMRGAPAP